MKCVDRLGNAGRSRPGDGATGINIGVGLTPRLAGRAVRRTNGEINVKKQHPAEQQRAEPRLEELRLADLTPHPDQAIYFRNYPVFEYGALKADIESKGLLHPIMVLPPDNAAGLPANTVITGHTRRKILLELGHDTTEALVRHDLRSATRADVDKLFLTDNVARRQQDRLGQARAAVRLFQIERELRGRSALRDPLRNGEVRDRVGQIVDMSGRNLSRYLNVLAAPVEVQDAFQAKRVTLVTAAKVSGLPKGDQAGLAARLRAGEDAKDVFAEFFPPRGGKHVKTADAVAAFARSIERAAADLAGRVEKVKPGPVRRNEDVLRGGERLIRRLLAVLDE